VPGRPHLNAHLPRRPGPGWVRGVVALSLLVLVAGCAKEPVSIEQVTVTRDDEARCAALVAALPKKLADLDRRRVAPAAALGAAWGDPAVVLTCGVDDKLPKAAACQEVEGVGWYAPEEAFDDQSLDVELTTIGLRPVVHVHVPAKYRPPPAIMVQLAPALKATLAATGGCV
jgi:hypothetical protein